MIFLSPLYNFLARHLATEINHFALVKLVIVSLDKTIFYTLLFAIIRLIWLLAAKKRRSHFSEVGVWLFVSYLIFLLSVTTFRESYFPWQLVFNWHHPLSDINLVFLKETWKLTQGASLLDFFYNSLGNVACFMPLGLLFPNLLQKKSCPIRTISAGLLTSLFIETMQFGLGTGVSDIDDVFFNTVGSALGYFIYFLWKKRKDL